MASLFTFHCQEVVSPVVTLSYIWHDANFMTQRLLCTPNVRGISSTWVKLKTRISNLWPCSIRFFFIWPPQNSSYKDIACFKVISIILWKVISERKNLKVLPTGCRKYHQGSKWPGNTQRKLETLAFRSEQAASRWVSTLHLRVAES